MCATTALESQRKGPACVLAEQPAADQMGWCGGSAPGHAVFETHQTLEPLARCQRVACAIPPAQGRLKAADPQ